MLKWDRSALTATYNIYLCTSWNKVPLGSKRNCNFPQCLQQVKFGHNVVCAWALWRTAQRAHFDPRGHANWPGPFIWLQQLWITEGSGRPLCRRWTGRVPSYPWSLLEPTTVNSPGIRKSLGRSIWVQWLRTIAFRKNCACRFLWRALEEWIRLGLETFAEVVVNKSLLIQIQQKSLLWPKSSIGRKLKILVTYRHIISHPS